MIVTLENVCFGYNRGSSVLKDVSFTVTSGSVLVILGPSGCGKSTLLRIICGALPASPDHSVSGRVLFNNEPPTVELRALGRVGFMFQEPTLLPSLTAEENVRLPLRLMRREPALDQTEALLLRMGLSNCSKCLPRSLSGGMQTRVALARTLITEPDILLLDEPFSSLDIGWKLSLYGLFSQLRTQHGRRTSIIVTHDVAEAFLLADLVIVLSSDGRILHTCNLTMEKPSSFIPRDVNDYLEKMRSAMLISEDLLAKRETS